MPTKQASPLAQVVELSDTEERIRTPSPQSERFFIDLTTSNKSGTDQEVIEPFTPTKPTLKVTETVEISDTDERRSVPQHKSENNFIYHKPINQTGLDLDSSDTTLDLAYGFERSVVGVDKPTEQVKLVLELQYYAGHEADMDTTTRAWSDPNFENPHSLSPSSSFGGQAIEAGPECVMVTSESQSHAGNEDVSMDLTITSPSDLLPDNPPQNMLSGFGSSVAEVYGAPEQAVWVPHPVTTAEAQSISTNILWVPSGQYESAVQEIQYLQSKVAQLSQHQLEDRRIDYKERYMSAKSELSRKINENLALMETNEQMKLINERMKLTHEVVLGDLHQIKFRQAQLEHAVREADMDLAKIYEVSPASLEGAQRNNAEKARVEQDRALMAKSRLTRRRMTMDTDDEDTDDTAEIEAEMKKREDKRKWNLQKRAREKFVHGNEPFQSSSEQMAEDERRRAQIAEQEREAEQQKRKRMAECITGSDEALATLKKIEDDKILFAQERKRAEEDKKRQEKEREHFWDDVDNEEMGNGEEESEGEDDSVSSSSDFKVPNPLLTIPKMAANTNAHTASNIPPNSVAIEPNAEQQQVQQPTAPTMPATPSQPRRWGFGSVLNTVKQLIPRLTTPIAPQEAPATAPPATHVPATEGMALNESPSSARAQRQAAKPRRRKSRKDNRSRLPPLKTKFQSDKAYARTLLKRVPDEQRPVVQSWYDDIRVKAEENYRVRTGDKRKRMEEVPKIDELASIPSHPPWQANGYGLTEGFFEYSDSDSDDQGNAKEHGYVPEYYQKFLQAEHPDSPPAKKKCKTTHIDSFGRSTSRSDLHPRPSFMPSPMFENRGHQYQGGNVFQQEDAAKPKLPPDSSTTHQVQRTAEERESYEQQLKRTGHVAGSGTFCVPEGDSDDEDSTMLDSPAANEATTSASAPSAQDKANASTNYKAPTVEDAPATSSVGSSNFKPWTQQPPPAPTPAHASLPGMTPADASSSSPQKAISQLPAAMPAAKPATGSEAESVKRQRERLEKYKPAIPSGLRESSRLSTSTVNSDASGDNETINSNAGPSLGSGLLTQAYSAKSASLTAPSGKDTPVQDSAPSTAVKTPATPLQPSPSNILSSPASGKFRVRDSPVSSSLGVFQPFSSTNITNPRLPDRSNYIISKAHGRFWNAEYPAAPDELYKSMFVGPLPEIDDPCVDEDVLHAVSQAVMKNPMFVQQSVECFYGKDSGFAEFDHHLFEDDDDLTDMELVSTGSDSDEAVFGRDDARAVTIQEMDKMMAADVEEL